MTSSGTKNQDLEFKKKLYEQLEVAEYWLFDPRGEWITEKLRGYRLQEEEYQLITDGCSIPLQLRLEVEGELISFYRQDTGEKLLIPEELAEALKQERREKELVQQKLEQMETLLQRYREQFGEIKE